MWSSWLSVIVVAGLAGVAVAAPTSCSDPYFEFWTGVTSGLDPTAVIQHAAVPAIVNGGYILDAGFLGENRFASLDFQNKQDGYATPYANGQVSTTTGLPISKMGGYPVQQTGFTDDFSEGLDSSRFVCLLEKHGDASNVDVVQDLVGTSMKNVVQLTANSDGTAVSSTGLIQTAGLFTAGKFEVVARFPPVQGVVSSVWGFHFEEHFEKYASEDPQFLSDLNTHGATLTNHEIDMEIPASCSGMCTDGGCTGEFDTMNLNAYRYTNSDGEGPAYANLCVRAPGYDFVDEDYHTYTFEWHTGDNSDSCEPHINFYFDGDYIGVGVPMWSQAFAYISSVSIETYSEARSTNFPQIDDEPIHHPEWVKKDIPPPVSADLSGTTLRRQPTFVPLTPDTPSPFILYTCSAVAFVIVVGGVVAAVVIVRRRERRRLAAHSNTVKQRKQEARDRQHARCRLPPVMEADDSDVDSQTSPLLGRSASTNV